MVRQIGDNQKDIILNYVGLNYPECLYLYMDIKQYSIDKREISVWYHENGGNINIAYLKYHSAIHLFSKDNDYDKLEVIKQIEQIDPSFICGKASIIRDLKDDLKQLGYNYEIGNIGRLRHIRENDLTTAFSVTNANLDDVEDIAKLIYEDEGLGASYDFDDLIDQMKERLSSGFVRSWGIKDANNKVVSHIGTGAEVDNICMTTYVVTSQEYRKQGMATAIYSYLGYQLQQEGKEVYTVYYLDSARKMHYKVGFEDYCEFGKLFKNV